jgi:DNA (cytosine-5)-methyltransferase 1
VHECARLQGFPDDWDFTGSAAAQYLQIGNAVPIVLGAAVGAMMVRHLDGAGEVETRSIGDMLADATTCLRQAARNRRRGPSLD